MNWKFRLKYHSRQWQRPSSDSDTCKKICINHHYMSGWLERRHPTMVALTGLDQEALRHGTKESQRLILVALTQMRYMNSQTLQMLEVTNNSALEKQAELIKSLIMVFTELMVQQRDVTG